MIKSKMKPFLVFILSIVVNQIFAQTASLDIFMENATLKEFIAAIEEKTDYSFMLDQTVDQAKQITVREEKATIRTILDKAFAGKNLHYEIVGKQIILKNAPPATTTKTVTGIIKDENGEPVIGVNVIEKGTTNGIVTDLDGHFSILVPEDAILQISYIGFLVQDIPVRNKNSIQITLREDTQALDEVVIVGYGIQKKANLTGAVSQVQMKDVLGDRPVVDAKSALQGAVPGLVITGGSSPGESRSINIRGINSINGGEPLVLIDNVPGTLDLINPEDIESVSVLKDASASAIYGARGAFGVILVTTKKAKKNTKLQINYNTNIAFQKSINRPKSATVEQILETYLGWYDDGKYYAQSQDLEKWLGYVREYNSDPGGFRNKYPGSYLEDGRFMPAGENIYYYLTDQDPYNSILDNYGFQQTHNLSTSGGGDRITYRMSFGYTDQDGPLLTSKDSYNRLNMTSYVNGDITDWLSQSIDVSHSKAKRSYLTSADTKEPSTSGIYKTTTPAFMPTEMAEANDPNGIIYPVNTPRSYLQLADPSRTVTDATRIFLRTSLRPFEGFEGIFEYTYDKNQYDFKRYTNNEQMIMMEQSFENLSSTPTYHNYKSTTVINALNVYGTYEKSLFDDHFFKIMAGYNQESRDYEMLKVTKTDMINPDMPSFSGSTGITTANDEYREYAIRSGFFRFNYNYKEKYLLEVNGRYDGSSKFPHDTRYGFFPSFSAGWQLGREQFMGWSEGWLNELKPRISWGQLGNQAGVVEYGYMPGMETEKAYWVVNGERPTTLKAPALVRSNYTWEKVETLGIGLDVSLLDYRLTGVFDWYDRRTKGMLAPGLELPGVVGADAPMQNVANLQTKGWEISIKWRDNIGAWRYSVGVNLYDGKTEITKYKNEAGLFYDRNDAQTAKRYRVGMELGEIWGYVTDGFYDVDDFSDLSNWTLKEGVVKLNGYTSRPGDVKFKDLDGDNIISIGENTVENPGDRKIIGNNTARYQFGSNLSVGWKDFDLSVFLQGVGKRDYWLGGDIMFGPSVHYGNVFSHQLNYWKPADWKNGDYTAANSKAFYPRIYDRNNNSGTNYRIQTKYLSNAAYLRLKNITLSYNIPLSALQKVGLSAGKVFFSGENIFTKSDLPKGVDPERMNWGYPFYATYSFGLSVTL